MRIDRAFYSSSTKEVVRPHFLRSYTMFQVPAIALPRLPGLLKAMPKVELHMHIEGALEPEMIVALARRNGVPLPYPSVESLRSAYTFTNLQSFLSLYYANTCVLLQEQDFYEVTWAYFERAKADGVVRAELFFDLQTHTSRGVAIGAVIEGLSRACVDAQNLLGISSDLILCFLRHVSEEEALETLENALPWRSHFIGIGLDSSEVGYPPETFIRVFARSRELGFHVVAHAGEEGPPAYVWSALNQLKVERIDHGVQSIHDAALIQHLVDTQVPLTVCPLSNLKLRVCKSLTEHSLGQMLEAGVHVTINSDDPAYFGGYLLENYLQIFGALNLGAPEAYRLAANSIEASFSPDQDKQRWMLALKQVFEQFTR